MSTTERSFYSKLKLEGITDEDYERVLHMWNRYECKTLEDYTQLYAKLDTLLLVNVFKNFRRIAFQEYGLDPAHC